MKLNFKLKTQLIACAYVLLAVVFTSCGTTEIGFIVDWSEVWKTIGLIVLGAVIVIAIILWLFRNFRVY